MFENTQLRNPDFPLPPAELIKSENIPKLSSLCQKVPLLCWVSDGSCAEGSRLACSVPWLQGREHPAPAQWQRRSQSPSSVMGCAV